MRYRETLDKLIYKAAYINGLLESLKKHEVDRENRDHVIAGAAREGEALAVGLRKILIYYTFDDESTPLERISTTAGFKVYQDGEEVVIELPPLPLRKGPARNFKYIVDPLLFGLEQFVRETGYTPMEYGIVKIIHVRPEETPIRKLHDYDNMEVKKVLDAVSLHLLVDDNMRRCQVCHMSAFGEEAWTQIRVSPSDGGDKTLLKRVDENVNPSTVEPTEYFGEKVSEENHFSKGSLLTDGSRSLCRLVRSIIPPSLLHRSQSSVGRVNPSQIVVINIPVNHTPHLCHGHLRCVHPVEFFFLKCRKKTLHSRIVVTSARSAHALDCSVFS